METLLTLDQFWFLLINQDLSNGFFDVVLPLIRNKFFWVPLYIFIIGFALSNYRRPDSYLMVICLIISVVFADLISSHALKKSIERPRPCRNIMLQGKMETKVYCGRGYSFPSSHATNHFCLATSIMLIFGIRRKWLILTLVTWAGLISFSQIYVGVHYPLDVISGSFVGVICGFFSYWIFLKLGILIPNRSLIT